MSALALSAATERPAGPLLHIRSAAAVRSSLDATFAFFSDAANLERLTPPSLRFTILTPRPIVMREGAIIDYRITMRGVPMAWQSRIDVWEPGVRFVDRQVIGPYRWWRHEHRFEAWIGGTLVEDHVEYLPRFAFLSGRLVERELARIFSFRQHALQRMLR
jgi:ligand-binding SRPBCC domain-containing protein